MNCPDTRPKEVVIKEMFACVAPHYDLVNRLMTFGQDKRWRRDAVRMARPGQGWALDVATGTGDIALELTRHTNHVLGLDLCLEMLQYGQKKIGNKKDSIDLIAGDALGLPFRDDSFDCALNGFALRNVADIKRFLGELHRVVKPGSNVVCLELVRPSSGIIGTFYKFYINSIVPVLGRRLSGDDKAYRYLPDSVGRFLKVDEVKKLMEEVGFHQVSSKTLNLGTIAIYVGTK